MSTNTPDVRLAVAPSKPAAPGPAARTRYRLRFAAEALLAAWRGWQALRRDRSRTRRWRRLAAACALLLPTLLLTPPPARAPRRAASGACTALRGRAG